MKILYKAILLCTPIVLTSCGGGDMFTLNIELNNKDEKNIYAIYDDPIAKIDTIKLNEGKFEYTFLPDTITLMRLVNDSGLYVPIFADKGWKVNFKGSFSEPQVTGNGPNNELQNFRNLINKDTTDISSKAQDFILSNRESYASAYIFNQYFIQSPNPDLQKLNEIITQMDGHIKDCRIVDITQKILSDNKEEKSEYLNYFSCKNRSGKYVSWSSKEELYTLSIDFDKSEWEKHCKKENEQWIETCDFEGWQNIIVKQMNISKLPYNILVTKNRKIITSCIYDDELVQKVKDLIQENKKKK